MTDQKLCKECKKEKCDEAAILSFACSGKHDPNSHYCHGGHPQGEAGKCRPEDGECAHCGNAGALSKVCDNKCGCHGPTEKEEGCPCDFHTKDLTEEQARIALFKPMNGGEKAPPLVLIERFHHLWDARSLAITTLTANSKPNTEKE